MRKIAFALTIVAGVVFTSCSSDDNDIVEQAATPTCSDGIQNGDETGVDCGGTCTPCKSGGENTIENPTTYAFDRDGTTTVDFSGQTTRLKMGGEFVSALSDNMRTAEQLQAMFAHEAGNADFTDVDLNASDKSIKSKTAASADFFGGNATDQAAIRADFDGWITGQVEEVFVNWETTAAPGVAGQMPHGEQVRYINAKGLEYNQMINKGLIGALALDQIVNNYLSPAVLDEGDNRTTNDADTMEEGKSYTAMEHMWDEAYGYLFGLNTDAANPLAGENDGDRFLGSYIGQVAEDPDFSDLLTASYDAFKLGRAAIVAKDYAVRDEQAKIIKAKLALVPSVRGVFYLQAGKNALAEAVPNYGEAFHALSEAYGFIYSLQFAQDSTTGKAYFTKAEVDALLAQLLADGENGLWDVTPETLDRISESIATKFGFTVAQAAPEAI
ncbi:protein of unknown function [Pricia antarctica]|uniref:DUF4856 domain-containing protein n=1 Tax=Pricia antarctica TaxID=641691 RepID=A0A1G6ZW10_9FLAO|nr:DUF4856 domain-containing protein [Pricia antarctica]SDE06868.1 protein of unknown function [Pricia antarctica]